jgi:hypothetical protein
MLTRRIDGPSRVKLQALQRRRGVIAREIGKVEREIRQVAGRALARTLLPPAPATT